jgi:uncharacterized membrane protein YgcG
MLSAICAIILGLVAILFGELQLHALAESPVNRVPLISMAFGLGIILVTLGILRLVYRSPVRRRGDSSFLDSTGYLGNSLDTSSSSDPGHSGHHGHSSHHDHSGHHGHSGHADAGGGHGGGGFDGGGGGHH